MASYGQYGQPHPAPRHSPFGSHAPPPMAAPGVVAPAGTFAPGTKIQVGSHRVVIQKYLSEGGFAHVYLVKLPKPIDGTDLAVLKRVAVPDKDSLRGMRTEVETMKRLKGHRPIVTYIDSHASEMKNGGYEVFLLMENCDGGGLIDFMNTRLQHRLTEPEILAIFSDIAEGVACMHYLKPALLHRDIKVENVLITARGSSKRFKLCDFGSAATPRPAPTTVTECRLMDEDIQKHTTLQYRSPEMVDVYRKQPMDEKCDIWALGVLLYKLCYYTTPFEDQGQLAILNASFRFPSHPPFSDRLKKLIASMLKENMQSRPNIYEVLKEACAMQKREVPIHNIYAGQGQAKHRDTAKPLPNDPRAQAHPAVGAVYSPPAEAKPSIPEVVPMRRGRPTSSAPSQAAAPPKVTKGDPFAALDSSKSKAAVEADDISSRFPSLDQFSLLHDSGSKFDFEPSAASPTAAPSSSNPKLAERLADEVFAPSHGQRSSVSATPPIRPHSANPPAPFSAPKSRPDTDYPLHKVPSAPSKSSSDVSRAQSIISQNADLEAIASRTTSRYVSTGTMTGPDPSSQTDLASQLPKRVSSRISSINAQSPAQAEVRRPEEQFPAVSRSSTLQSDLINMNSSPRLSIQGDRPNQVATDVPGRFEIPQFRPRPVSTNLENSSLDYLREKELSRPQSRASPNPIWSPPKQSPNITSSKNRPDGEPLTETSDIEYLRSLEEREARNEELEVTVKRSSMEGHSHIKPKLVGKLGEAFKRFEPDADQDVRTTARTPSPLKELSRGQLLSDPQDPIYESRESAEADDLSPEKKRELERQQLLDEEARVAKAQAEYRSRFGANGGPRAGSGPTPASQGQPAPRALSIQNRVQSLLSEEARTTPVQRSAEGYGKYSDAATAASKVEKPAPSIPRKPVMVSRHQVGLPANVSSTAPNIASRSNSGNNTVPGNPSRPVAGRPTAPKKPIHLNSIPTGGRPASPVKALRPVQPVPPANEELLIAMDLPGNPTLDMSAAEKDNYLEDFSKRFPSLGSIEMVERDVGAPDGGRGQVR